MQFKISWTNIVDIEPYKDDDTRKSPDELAIEAAQFAFDDLFLNHEEKIGATIFCVEEHEGEYGYKFVEAVSGQIISRGP